jgi:PIN domain nuclease of toxin-antitoxin system
MMLLLDSHAFLWFCQDDPSLSVTARSMIEDAGNQKLVSIASCWEIAIKAGLGKLKLGEPSATYLANALSRTGFEILPISLAHAAGVETLPLHHRDPFDRLLVASALAERTPVVRIDAVHDQYGVTCLW